MAILPIISEASTINYKFEMWGNHHDYAEDFKHIIKQREKARIPFLHQSPEINYRSHLIEYLKNYAVEKNYSYSCLHLAIYLLDIFMDNHVILPEKLELVAGACLLISAKFEECTTNIPKLKELNATAKNRYSLKDYKVAEILILKFFSWYLILPTAAHYVYYFMLGALSPDDLKNNNLNYRILVYNLQDYIKTYLDKVIEDIHYMQLYVPSRLAAAIIAAARKRVGLNSWSEQLENLTDYSKQQIKEPVQALLRSNVIAYCAHCSN